MFLSMDGSDDLSCLKKIQLVQENNLGDRFGFNTSFASGIFHEIKREDTNSKNRLLGSISFASGYLMR